MKSENTIRETNIAVQDLCCAAEEALIRKKLGSLDGIRQLQFNLISHKLSVSHTVDEHEILKALKEIGLPGRIENKRGFPVERATSNTQLISFVVSASLMGLGGIFSWAGMQSPLPQLFYVFAILSGGWFIFVKAFRSLTNRWLDINVLMTVAVVGAIVIGHFGEGAAVTILYALSLLLESRSIERTRQAIQALMKLSPSLATVKKDGITVQIPVEEVSVGDIVLVKPGERIPVDSKVISGVSSVDQSAITGESVPIAKRAGDEVFAGSFNQRGALEVQTIRPASDSTLSRIIHLVEEAQTQRAHRQTLVERFARVYTPAVFLLAICVASIPPLLLHQEFGTWFYRSLVLLVIACPCALVISTPVTIASALTNAARHGILIKGGIHLENLASIDAVAFDKTGTLTEGRIDVIEVIPLNSLSRREIIKIAASVELHSEHHLAQAFLSHADRENVRLDDIIIEQFESIPGKGVRAVVNRNPFSLGNHQFAEELGVCSPEVERLVSGVEARGHTAVILANEKEALGIISLADRVRTESKGTLTQLRGLGVREAVLLTGDSRSTAMNIAAELGFDTVRADLMPQDKLAVIEELKSKYQTVCMVGDGVNDAPALALSDLGVAMGGIGSDSALETADVVLMSDDLSKMPFGMKLGKKALRAIRQNIILAIVTKLVFLTLGVLGVSSLWLAILADDGATILVVLNGLRLLRNPK